MGGARGGGREHPGLLPAAALRPRPIRAETGTEEEHGEQATFVVQTATEHYELRQAPLPDIGDDDALLALEGCGVCGTDVEVFEGPWATATRSCLAMSPSGASAHRPVGPGQVEGGRR